MPRPLSQLRYSRIQDQPGLPHVIALHDFRETGEAPRSVALAAAPNGRVIGLESYKGVYIGREVVGYTWFVGPDERPSPIFFGDALAEIERFLWDEIDRQAGVEAPTLPFLVGVGQGGIMALATAAAVPDLISGVVAIDAFLPIVPGWDPPLSPLDGLPILLLEHAGFAPPTGTHVLQADRLETTLLDWGAHPTRIANLGDEEALARLRAWTAEQDIRQYSSTMAEG